jgi:hypothetical protein
MSPISAVRKGMRQTAKVGDVVSLTDDLNYPLRVAVRFALILSLLAFVVAAIALAAAVSK